MKTIFATVVLSTFAINFCLVELAIAQSESAQNYWAGWRGPIGTGVAPSADPPIEWSEEENVLWKTAIPGVGHSSPIVWGDYVFVTSAVPYGDTLESKPDTAPGAHDNSPVNQKHRFVVAGYLRSDGKELWQTVVNDGLPVEGGHYTGSLASNSPVTDGKHVYAFFGSRGLYCLDFDGNIVWQRHFGEMQTKHAHGEGSSPALFNDTLIVNWDHEGNSFVVALDTADGTERWKVSRTEKTSWASPIIITHNGRQQVIISGTNRIRSYDLETGDVIWQCGGLSDNVVATPVSDGSMVYAGSSYDTRAMMGIRLDDAKGDITGTDHVVWTIRQLTPYVPSPLLYGDSLYFLRHYQGVLTSLQAETGEQLIGSLRLPRMRDIYASPVGAADRIYVTDRSGVTIVISHNDFPRILSANRLDDRISATAAIAGKQLFLRGEKFLYCLQNEDSETGETPQ